MHRSSINKENTFKKAGHNVSNFSCDQLRTAFFPAEYRIRHYFIAAIKTTKVTKINNKISEL
jgi:hypothetical protein